MKKILISFCIPTFNRAEYLSETLSSIIDQSKNDIEIVISDNASEDNTEEIVNQFSKNFGNIKYFKWEKNVGADLNYMKSVDLASGEYCWFLGSDDQITNDAIAIMRKEIELKKDIYLCSEFFCDEKMIPYKRHYLLGRNQISKNFNFSNRSNLLDYFNLAQSHSALFGYLSVIIFKREKWNQIDLDQSYLGTLYSHMYMLYSFIDLGCEVRYLKDLLVKWRSGNDSFGGPGKIVERYKIDIFGFLKIGDQFFGRDIEIKNLFFKVFRRHHPFTNLAFLRMNTPTSREWHELEELLIKLNYNHLSLKILRPSLVKLILYPLYNMNKIIKEIRKIFLKENK